MHRLVSLAHDEQNIMDIEGLNSSFAHAFSALMEERPIICAKTAQEFTSMGTPDGVIIDVCET